MDKTSFGADSLSGRADDFVTRAGEEMTGSLDVASGRSFRNVDVEVDYTFGAFFEGRLRGEGGEEYVLNGTTMGDFFGTGDSHVDGSVWGTAFTPDGMDAIAGEFIAARYRTE